MNFLRPRSPTSVRPWGLAAALLFLAWSAPAAATSVGYVLDPGSQVKWANGGMEALGGPFFAFPSSCFPDIGSPCAGSVLQPYSSDFQTPSRILLGYSGNPFFNGWNFVDRPDRRRRGRLRHAGPGERSPANAALPDAIALNLVLHESVLHLTLDSQGRTVVDFVQPDTQGARLFVVAHCSAAPEPPAAWLLGAAGILDLLARFRQVRGSPLVR